MTKMFCQGYWKIPRLRSNYLKQTNWIFHRFLERRKKPDFGHHLKRTLLSIEMKIPGYYCKKPIRFGNSPRSTKKQKNRPLVRSKRNFRQQPDYWNHRHHKQRGTQKQARTTNIFSQKPPFFSKYTIVRSRALLYSDKGTRCRIKCKERRRRKIFGQAGRKHNDQSLRQRTEWPKNLLYIPICE